MAIHRIALVVRALDAGGSERQLTELAKHLDRNRFEPYVACLRKEGMRLQELHDAGVPVYDISVRSAWNWATLRSLRAFTRYLHEQQIRLVHTFDPPSNWIVGPAVKLSGAPVVLSSQRSSRQIRGRAQRHLLQLTDRVVDGIVVNSEAVKRELVVEYGVAEDRIHLCRNGIDLARFQRQDRAPKPGGVVLIGCICVLRKEKGLDTLLRAFQRIRSEFAGARLRIVGSGPEEASLRDLAAGLDLGDRCQFVPATGRVAEQLREMDVFVLPSLSEAMSNSLMEAMASGCCPIASSAGGNPELVKHDQTGLLFEPGDAAGLAALLERVMGDTALRQRLGEAASTLLYENFSLAAMARRMGDIYTSHLRARGF